MISDREYKKPGPILINSYEVCLSILITHFTVSYIAFICCLSLGVTFLQSKEYIVDLSSVLCLNG